MSLYHPQLDEHGKSVLLKKPSKPTSLSSWEHCDAVATVTPGGELPGKLNGISFDDWLDIPNTAEAWNEVEGQLNFDEPLFKPPMGKMPAAGVAIIESDGRIWLVSPSNGFAGYTTTLPKGRIDGEVSRQASAIREAYEEAGLKVRITGFLADSERSQTYTRYYLAQRVGGKPACMGWESQAVHLVPTVELAKFLTHPNDLPLLEALLSMKDSGLNRTRIVLHCGGNFVCVREAIRRFREQFGHWPTGLALGSSTLVSLKEHLTPLGYEMLEGRMILTPQIRANQILSHDDSGNQLDYTAENVSWQEGTVTLEEVDQWIWGIAL